jgi:predicted cobalt transporter CbtA
MNARRAKTHNEGNKMTQVRAVPRIRATARRAAVFVSTFVLMLTGVVAFAAPASASTPRAQFWEFAGFQGDKLGKDAFGPEPNLPALGRDCVPS